VDVWAIGVLAYELLTGLSPFSPNINVNNQKYVEAKTRANIKELNYIFPPNFPSTQAKDFITKILKLIPSERLQISEMKKHKFIIDHCNPEILKKIE
jgi:aurora kinase